MTSRWTPLALLVALLVPGCVNVSATSIVGCAPDVRSLVANGLSVGQASFRCDRSSLDGTRVANLLDCKQGRFPAYLSGSGQLTAGRATFTVLDASGLTLVSLAVTPGANKSFDQPVPFSSAYAFQSVLSDGFAGQFAATLMCYH